MYFRPILWIRRGKAVPLPVFGGRNPGIEPGEGPVVTVRRTPTGETTARC